MGNLMLQEMALRSTETQVTINQTTQLNILEDLNVRSNLTSSHVKVNSLLIMC